MICYRSPPRSASACSSSAAAAAPRSGPLRPDLSSRHRAQLPQPRRTGALPRAGAARAFQIAVAWRDYDLADRDRRRPGAGRGALRLRRHLVFGAATIAFTLTALLVAAESPTPRPRPRAGPTGQPDRGDPVGALAPAILGRCRSTCSRPARRRPRAAADLRRHPLRRPAGPGALRACRRGAVLVSLGWPTGRPSGAPAGACSRRWPPSAWPLASFGLSTSLHLSMFFLVRARCRRTSSSVFMRRTLVQIDTPDAMRGRSSPPSTPCSSSTPWDDLWASSSTACWRP